MFRSQSANQEELTSAIGDLRDEMSETNDKTDGVASRLNETVGVQNSMLSELRGIGKSIDNLNNMMQMFFMNQNSTSGSGGGGGGSISSSFSKYILGGVGIAAAVGAGGAGAAALNEWRARQESGGVGVPNPQSSPTSNMVVNSNNSDQISQILTSIKHQETKGESDPYTAIARGSNNKPMELGPNTGTGAYQFTPATWQESAKAANIDVSQYPQAKDAPAELQDRVAKARAAYLLKKAGGNISMVPAYWNGGENIDTNNMSPRVTQYRQEVMANYQKNQQAAQQQNGTPTSAAGTSDDYAQFLQSRSQNGVNAEKLNPNFASKLMKAIEEAERVTGEKVTITSGFRTPEQQAQLYANFIKKAYTYDGKVYTPNADQKDPVAKPGSSQHQTGHAVDLSRGAAREYIRKNAAKFGLIDLAGDVPHFSDAPETQAATTTSAVVGETPQNSNQQTAQQQSQSPLMAGLDMPTAQQQSQSPLMAGLDMPAGMGPGSEPSRIGMGDMDSYNPLGILASMAGGNMFGPSGRTGAIGAGVSLLAGLQQSQSDTRANQLNQTAIEQSAQTTATQWQDPGSEPGYQPPSREETMRRKIDPDTYNHPDDRSPTSSFGEKLVVMMGLGLATWAGSQ